MKSWPGYTHGINLGGWLSQCVHTEEHYECFIREEDFQTIRSWGLDHVRVPIDYNLVEDENGAYRESGFARIQNAIDWSRRNGLNLVLDLHKTYGFSFDAQEGEHGFFESESCQERFYRLWEELARRFARYQDTLAFELLNEVTEREYGPVWNRIAAQCIARIRAIAPEISILVGSYWHNSLAALPDLLPPPDEHIIYNFHCYEPIIFTHQGAYWMPPMSTAFRIPLSSRYGELAAAALEQLGEPSRDLAGLDPEARFSPDFFRRRFADAVKLAEERGVPLYCGEYGVIDCATPEDTLRWYAAIHEAFEAFGIGRAAWSFRQMDFGLSDARLDGVRGQLLPLL